MWKLITTKVPSCSPAPRLLMAMVGCLLLQLA
uniref:Uncharacterized protein n=1 Tax=Rhizophora mucronata TaxID=61149 RepID=A0A2P2PK88_RHIMU